MHLYMCMYVCLCVCSDGNNVDRNMRVYRCKDGALVFAQHQKNVNKDLWPVVHWSCDEKSMYRLVSNELQVYDTSQFGTPRDANDANVRRWCA